MSRVAWTVALLMLCGLLGASATGTGAATSTERIVRPGEEFQTYPAGGSPEERSMAAAKAAQEAAHQAKEAAEAITRAIASMPRPPPPGDRRGGLAIGSDLGNEVLDMLSADTPVRQSQRLRLGEKARFAQVFGERKCKRRKKSRRHRKKKRDGPAWNRVTGASKKYDPNDQMCAICQFLTQRIQLDMAHFNAMGNFLGAQTAASGSASAAAAGQAAGKAKNDDNFLELATSVTPKATEEEEDTTLSAFLQVGQKVTLRVGGASAAALSGLSWAEQDELEARQLELQAKADMYERAGDWDKLEQLENQRTELAEAMRLAAVEAKEEAEEDEEDEDSTEEEDSEEETDEDEEADEEEEDSEEDESEEDDSESETASAAAESSEESALTETEAVVAQGLTDVEKQEMEDALQETRTVAVANAIRKTIDSATEEETTTAAKPQQQKAEEGESSFLEKKGETEVFDMDMLSKEDQDQLLEALDQKTQSELTLTKEERAEMAQMMGGEQDQDALDYATPTYTGDAPAASEDAEISDEDLSFVQVSSDVDDEDSISEELDETETEQIGFDDAADDEHNTVALPVSYRDAPANPNARRSYARMLHRAELTPTPTVFAETTGQHRNFMSSEGRFGASMHSGSYARARVAGSRKPKHPKGIGLANSPRRFRLADALYSRPRWNRFDPTVQPHPNPQREQARQMWEKLLHMTYDRLEGYCSTRLPEQFSPFCRPMLRKFRVVAEGLRYGDRPNQICMRTRFCPRGSYVRKSAHNVFKIVPRRRRH